MEFTTEMKTMKDGAKKYADVKIGSFTYRLFSERDEKDTISLAVEHGNENSDVYKVASVQVIIEDKSVGMVMRITDTELQLIDSKSLGKQIYNLKFPGYWNKVKKEYHSYAQILVKGGRQETTDALVKAWEKICSDEGVEEVGAHQRPQRQTQAQ